MQKISELIKAPLMIFSTRTGTPFNLTPTNQPAMQAIQITAGDFIHLKSVIKALPQHISFKNFLGYKNDILTYLAPYDYGKPYSMNWCKSEKVKIMARNGYQEVSSKDYYELVELIRPDYWVALTEVPSLIKQNNKESSNLLKRAIGKTNAFLRSLPTDKMVPGLLVPIHGGHNAKMLKKSIDESLTHSTISGIVINDLCERETLEEREETYKTIMHNLYKKSQQTGKHYVVCLAGEGRIDDIKQARKFGIDWFEVSYPFTLAEQQKALVYADGTFIVKTPVQGEYLNPLDPTCQCKACVSYSQSYIAHLVKSHEMTGKVLLAIHNSYQYFRNFKN